MRNGTVVVLCPMDCEAELILSRLEDKKEKHIGGYTFFEGKMGNSELLVVRCLIGSVNAAVCTAYAAEHYSPSCVILQGTSGAHDPGYDIGDIVIAEKIVPLCNTVSQSRDIKDGSNPFEWECFGVQTYSKKEEGTEFKQAFFCDKELVALAKKVPYDFGNVTVGTVGCGDVWNKEADLILHYRKTKGTDCEAMEGIGAAQVCEAFGVPMLEVRVISNNELCGDKHFSADSAEKCQLFVLDLIKEIEKIGR